MNLVTLYRDHPDLAEMIGDPRAHLASCHDCDQRFPPDKLRALDGEHRDICGDCMERRIEVAWAEWRDQLAKESREGTA